MALPVMPRNQCSFCLAAAGARCRIASGGGNIHTTANYFMGAPGGNRAKMQETIAPHHDLQPTGFAFFVLIAVKLRVLRAGTKHAALNAQVDSI